MLKATPYRVRYGDLYVYIAISGLIALWTFYGLYFTWKVSIILMIGWIKHSQIMCSQSYRKLEQQTQGPHVSLFAYNPCCHQHYPWYYTYHIDFHTLSQWYHS